MVQLKILSSLKKSVLILDTSTSKVIRHCIPKGIDFEEIQTRNSVNIVFSLNFFLYLTYFILKTKRINLSVFLAICKVKQSSVVITFTDNTELINLIGDTLFKLGFGNSQFKICISTEKLLKVLLMI